MTKEELRKEAEEWLSITDNHLNDERTHFLSESEYAEQAYLAGAEPREKRIAELEEKLANADYQLEGRDLEIKELEAQIEKMKQDLDSARENANRQEQWEIYSVLNGIYNDNFEVITGVSN